MENTMYSIENAQKLNEELVQKAWESSTFKEQLIDNPIETIEQYAENRFTIPAGINVIVEDQTDQDTIFFNIPPMPNLDSLELTEEELEQVAGGWTFMYTVGISLVGLAIKGFQDGRAAANA